MPVQSDFSRKHIQAEVEILCRHYLVKKEKRGYWRKVGFSRHKEYLANLACQIHRLRTENEKGFLVQKSDIEIIIKLY